MANADFSKQKNTAPGGFSADSYRAEQKQAERPLTPVQQKLSKLENALPAFLKNQGAAAAVLAVVMCLSVFGVSGARLHKQYTRVRDSFSQGVAEDVKSGSQYTMAAMLAKRVSEANNTILAAQEFDGVSPNMVSQAQTALTAMQTAISEKADPAALYDADIALEAAIKLLHAEVQDTVPEAEKNQTGSEQSAYSQFYSAGNTMKHLHYNENAQSFNEQINWFPANVIGALWGCGTVQPFA